MSHNRGASSVAASSVAEVGAANNTAVFLASIEAKLRNPFTSLDLSKTIDRETEPYAFLNAVNENVFDQHAGAKMDKIAKLRVLISLLGLDKSTIQSVVEQQQQRKEEEDFVEAEDTDMETNDDSSDDIIWTILQNAQKAADDEEWTRVIAGIVQGKMYAKPVEGDQQKTNNEFQPSRGEEIDNLFCESNGKIIKDTLKTWRTHEDGNNTIDGIPFYAPMKYHLLDPSVLRQRLPELYANIHFTTPVVRNCDILQSDPKAEQIRATEEEKELESQRLLQERKKMISTSNGNNSTETGADNKGISAVTSVAARTVPNVAPTGGVLQQQRSLAASAQKPVSSTTSFLRTGLGHGRLASGVETAGAGGRVVGRGMSAAAKAALAMRDMARTAAATSSTGSRVALTMPTKHPGGAALAARLASRSTVTGGSAATAKGRMTGGAASKMKMIDVNEVQAMENQKRAGEIDIDDSRARRKLKLMEEAEARGLKSNKRWGTAGTVSADGPTATFSSDQILPENTQKEPLISNTSMPNISHQISDAAATMPVLEGAHQQQYQSNISSLSDATAGQAQLLTSFATTVADSLEEHELRQQLYAAPTVNVNGATDMQVTANIPSSTSELGNSAVSVPVTHDNWQQLLEKSNKLTPEDRSLVEQFFVSHYNPTPEQPHYKLKLHEEKSSLPDGQVVKETLYLVLDYNTFGYKKLRKIKRK